MDEKIVEEMVQSNRVIVRQLREMLSKGLKCSCPCHALQISGDEFKLQAIEDRLAESEKLIRAFDDKQKELEAEIQRLKSDNAELCKKLTELSELIEESVNDKVVDEDSEITDFDGGATGCSVDEPGDNNKDNNDHGDSNLSISQPNFRVEQNVHQDPDPTSPIATVEKVIQRTIKITTDFDWKLKAQAERGMFPLTPRINGPATVICVDISASMLENGAWNHAHQFITEYIQGLENMRDIHGIKEEFITLMTFGHSTNIIVKLTNRYDVFKQAFDNLKVGGPTPMLGGLLLTGSALSTARELYDVGGIPVFNKIVLITDGNPTETCKIAGPDKVGKLGDDKNREMDILNMCKQIRSSNYTVYCVPCGNANQDFLSRLVKISDGKMIRHTDGEWMSRRLFLTIKAAKNQFDLCPGITEETDNERIEMAEILAESQRRQYERQQRQTMEIYRDSDNPNLPPVGSRVRVGPDWKAGDISRNEPGTIIGHSLADGFIWVDWDEGGKQEHRYGYNGQYEVLIVDEPKVLSEQFIMGIGCEVVKGPHWKTWNGVLEEGMKGTSIKLDGNKGVVQVKWKNGERGVYSYLREKQEVMLVGRLPSLRERLHSSRERLPSSMERLPSNMERLPTSRHRLPSASSTVTNSSSTPKHKNKNNKTTKP